MVNPFKDTNWNPGLAEKRSFAKSLIIGFPALALLFTLTGWLKTHAFPGWTPWLAVIGAGTGVILWLLPQFAKPFYLAWYFVACCIGIVVSNLLIAAFFYAVVFPFALIMRVLKRDPMHRQWDSSATTYWRDREMSVDPKRYFRQF